MDTIFRQRKFALALLFSITSVVGLFTGVLTEGAFIALVGLILGLYGAANVTAKRLTPNNGT